MIHESKSQFASTTIIQQRNYNKENFTNNLIFKQNEKKEFKNNKKSIFYSPNSKLNTSKNSSSGSKFKNSRSYSASQVLEKINDTPTFIYSHLGRMNLSTTSNRKVIILPK